MQKFVRSHSRFRRDAAMRMNSGSITTPLFMTILYSLLYSLVFDPRYRKARLAAAFGVYALIVILGSIPGGRQEIEDLRTGMGIPSGTHSGWWLHALSYGFITAMLFGGLGRPAFSSALRCLIIIAFMGGIDEGIQTLLPYRSGKMPDWEVDVLSGMFCLVILWLIHSYGSRRQPPAIREPDSIGINEQLLLLGNEWDVDVPEPAIKGRNAGISASLSLGASSSFRRKNRSHKSVEIGYR